jgi:hypothetical protein
MYVGFRLKRTLASYDIEASVHSRLMSGMVQANVPMYQVTPHTRHQEEYWQHKATDGSKHGISWDGLNWIRTPIEVKVLQVHLSDRIQLPEARTNLAELIHYLGDLGLQTCPIGFRKLARDGLKVLPGTCLVEERIEGQEPKPILVVAKPTLEHPGSLVLKLENALRSHRGKDTTSSLDPSWIPVTTTKRTSSDSHGLQKDAALPAEATKYLHNRAGSILEVEVAEYLRITNKGIVSIRYSSGELRDIYGYPFWFAYCLLAISARSGHNGAFEYNGRPCGFRIHLNILYFAREFCLPINGNDYHEKWCKLFTKFVEPTKLATLPIEWTEDSESRRDIVLCRRFEEMIPTADRNHSQWFRTRRQRAIAFAQDPVAARKTYKISEDKDIYIPLEVCDIGSEIWSEAACDVSFKYRGGLSAQEVPTCAEICLAACAEPEFATRISVALRKCLTVFKREGPMLSHGDPSPEYMVIVMCALIVLKSIADGSPYLADLGDVGECCRKWDPVYLC